jgi:hypothetical protein
VFVDNEKFGGAKRVARNHRCNDDIRIAMDEMLTRMFVS